MSDLSPAPAGLDQIDRRNAAWYMDRGVQTIVFLGGVSAIVFIIGIFVFITKEGFGFIASRFDLAEFFASTRWTPTSERNPTYGALALIAGTASVTGTAMIVAIPFSLGAAVYIGEFATGRTREGLKIFVELLAAIPSVVWGFIGLSIMNKLIIDLFNVLGSICKNRDDIGLHLGNTACNMIIELVATQALEGGYQELARIIHPHPTISEAVMEAARAVDGWATHA